MKTIFKHTLLIGLLLLVVQCQKQDVADEFLVTAPTEAITNPLQLPLFKGLPVKHRFETSLEDLKTPEHIDDIKALYASFKAGNKGIQGRGMGATENLPSAQAIYEATKKVQTQFPYPKLGENPKLLLHGENSVNWDMIQEDFPNLSQRQLIQNAETIDEYYSTNLDYLVLQEIAQNKRLYASMARSGCDFSGATDYTDVNEFLTESCIYTYTMSVAVFRLYGFVRSSIAFIAAGNNAEISSENYYGDLAPGNSRRDTYRHTLWNALLAQYYWAIIPSKSRRMNFAKMVANCREEVTPGADDATEMDYHNNAIGRNLWRDNTGYLRFLGIVIGLDFKSTSELKDIIREKITKNSCKIVKDHPNGTTYDYTIEETKAQILATDSNTLVYFFDEIVPKRYITTFQYDYSDCKGGTNPDEIQRTLGGSNGVSDIDLDPCIKKIYTTTEVEACFVSKDPNYNPYN